MTDPRVPENREFYFRRGGGFVHGGWVFFWIGGGHTRYLSRVILTFVDLRACALLGPREVDFGLFEGRFWNERLQVLALVLPSQLSPLSSVPAPSCPCVCVCVQQ